MTYAATGVDQDAKIASAKSLLATLRFQRQGLGAPYAHEGGFSGLIEFGDVLLALATDGVGTKLMIAEEMGKWDTVGIDCVAMNVNDVICVGAEPIAFVDYIATPKPEPHVWAEIGKGLDEGCRQSNMTLVGGETSIMPEVVRHLDLTGTVLGFVPRDRVVTGQEVDVGDVLIGLPSNGLHSNGFTLVRKVVESAGLPWDHPFGGATLGETVLTPTTIYVRAVLDLLSRVDVKAMANITGGGLRNLARWGSDLRFVVDDPLPVPDIFPALAQWGGIEDREMWQTFNMGLGFAIAVAEGDARESLEILRSHQGAKVVGHVEEGSGVRLEPLDIEYAGY